MPWPKPLPEPSNFECPTQSPLTLPSQETGAGAELGAGAGVEAKLGAGVAMQCQGWNGKILGYGMMSVQMPADLMWIQKTALFPHLCCLGVTQHQGSLATGFHPVWVRLGLGLRLGTVLGLGLGLGQGL